MKYEWLGKTEPSDETGHVVFEFAGKKTEAIFLPHFESAMYLSTVLDDAWSAGRKDALNMVAEKIRDLTEQLR